MSRGLDNLHKEFRAEWIESINSLWERMIPSSATWHGAGNIMRVLYHFMGENRNHAHLPTGGGMDFISVEEFYEGGCLGFGTTAKSAYIMKPSKLHFECIEHAPGESFFMLELAELSSTGIYENGPNAQEATDYIKRRGQEEVVEIGQGEYLTREHWDEDFVDYDERGEVIRLPDNARLLTRWMRGKVLIVCKGSVWNEKPETYDGRHNQMSPLEIRSQIEAWL